MTEAISLINESLKGYYPPHEIRSLSRLVLQHVLNCELHQLLYKDIAITVEQEKEICEIVERLCQYEPVQYILGKTVFHDMAFEVNPSTLIPRPETEELVELIITGNKVAAPSILDIGTGSGCIAITLAKHISGSQVTAMDISGEAIRTARQNAERNGVNIQFSQTDILQIKSLPGEYDIIVSNPPYVTESDKKEMEENVLNHEPHSALFVPDTDPIRFYRAISHLAINHLVPGGKLFFEINARLGEETADAIAKVGFTQIEVIKDLFGKNRFIKACL